MTTEERLAWVSLARTPGIGPRRLAALLSHCQSATGVLEAPVAFLEGVSASVATLGRQGARALQDSERWLADLTDRGIAVLIPSDDAFPAALRSIPDPPVLLYARGQVPLLHQPAVAIVGSRDHSVYGREVARRLATAAAQAGIVVVSGMARGLDAEAHQAVLDVGGATVGVLGCGLDQVYPRGNHRLYQEVERHGALLTEYPPEALPHAGAFPRRNRLISGLARVLVVIEAAQRSGTMITVGAALEQGRTVMAVPGPITATTSWGTNILLRDGAEPLLDPEDLLRHFGVTPPAASPAVRPPPANLSAEEARVYQALTAEPRHLDELLLDIGLPAGITLGLLSGLELGGLVIQSAGHTFRRN